MHVMSARSTQTTTTNSLFKDLNKSVPRQAYQLSIREKQDGERVLHTDKKVAAQIPARIPYRVDLDISNGPGLYFLLSTLGERGSSPFSRSGACSSSLSLGGVIGQVDGRVTVFFVRRQL